MEQSCAVRGDAARVMWAPGMYLSYTIFGECRVAGIIKGELVMKLA